MTKQIFAMIFLILMVACATLEPQVPDLAAEAGAAEPALQPAAMAPAPPANAVTAEQFDTTTLAERAAAAVQPAVAVETELGRTIATLGNPVTPGFWLETPLVSAPRQGRVVYPATGNSVAVELIPIAGPATAGSRISLPAMRLLGAPLAGLPELIVFAG